LYLKVDVECIGRVQNWILERQKLSWLSFFFLWDLLCFVRYGAEECLGWAPWSMSFGCGRLLFFVLVLFWNNFFPLCTFIPSRSSQKRPCISQKAIWLFLHSATTL
jgi:hypothetical protein